MGAPVKPPPVGVVLAAMEGATASRRTYQLLGHLIFFGAFVSCITLARRIDVVWSVEESMRQHFYGWNHVEFKSVRTLPGIRGWLDAVLVPSVFLLEGRSEQRWHSSECVLAARTLSNESVKEAKLETDACQAGYVRLHNRIVSPIRFRQAVVRQDSCDHTRDEVPIHSPCFPPFAEDKALTEGLCQQEGWTHPCEYRDDLPRLQGTDGSDYGTSGFVLTIPRQRSRWKDAFDENFGVAGSNAAAAWFTRGTRVFAVEFLTYNANHDIATLARFQFDVTAGGRIQPSTEMLSARLLPYRSLGDAIRLGLEAVYIVGFLVFLVSVVRDALGQIRDRIYHAWTLVEIASVVFHAITIAIWVFFLLSTKRAALIEAVSLGQSPPPDQSMEFPNGLDGVLGLYNAALRFSAVNAVVMTFSVVHNLRALAWFAPLWGAVERSGTKLVVSAVVLLLMLLGFAIAGHLTFGGRVGEFRTLALALRALFLGLAGRLDYAAMRRASPVFAPVYVTAWLLCVILALTSLFVAVLAEGLNSIRDSGMRQENLLNGVLCRPALSASPLGRLLDQVLTRLPRTLIGRDAASLVDGAKRRIKVRAKLHEDPVCRAALKRVRTVSRRLTSRRKLRKQVEDCANSGFQELTLDEITELLGNRAAAEEFATDLAELQAHLEFREKQPEVASAPPDADATASARMSFWTQALDDEIREALNMLRFEVNTFSHAVRRLEHIKAPLPGAFAVAQKPSTGASNVASGEPPPVLQLTNNDAPASAAPERY